MSQTANFYGAAPSLGSATSTHLDSACKHIQQCRVSYDHMIDFVDNHLDLERNKMNYCIHKDEVVVGVSRPWVSDAVRSLPVSAYPRVLSCLGDITREKYSPCIRMIKYLYHFATSVQHRKEIINQFNNLNAHAVPLLGAALASGQPNYFNNPSTNLPENLNPYMSKMYDYYPVGVSNTLGYAHPNSGDTMSSVMIGGLRTVVNGDFEVYAGNLIQWYWSFEDDCFHREDGRRKAIADNTNFIIAQGGNPEVDWSQPAAAIGPLALPIRHPTDPRRVHNDYQFGRQPGEGRQASEKAKTVARVKPYIRDDEFPRIYDWLRVFAVAISSAGPNQLLDIKISKQSM